MNTSNRKLFGKPLMAMTVVGAVLVTITYYSLRTADIGQDDPAKFRAEGTLAPISKASGNTAVGGGASASDKTEVSASEMILRCLQRLKTARDPAESTAILNDLRDTLRGVSDRAGAIKSITGFLDSGQDTPTGLGFTVQPGGALGAAPSLRVALLDLLGELGRAEAARYAEIIFQRSQVPDEWAVALRDLGKHLGRNSAGSSPAYRGRVEQLLARKDWLDKPSSGFLHAFDAAVFVGGKSMIERLVTTHNMHTKREIGFASSLALDRLALADFTTTSDVIRSDNAFLANAPKIRATILSRANPINAGHMRLVHDYLIDTTVGIEEKVLFLRSFPNANLQYSNNLLTSNAMIFMANVADQDQMALALMQSWQGEEVMAPLRTVIENEIARLKNLLTIK
jgi:hypothetical protein